MPQLDSQIFALIVYQIVVIFYLCFAFMYVFQFLPMVNRAKIVEEYKTRIVANVAGISAYLQRSI